MFRLKPELGVPLLALLFCAFGSAATIQLTADLTIDEEPTLNGITRDSGEPRPVPFGDAMFLLDTGIPQMSMTVTIFNIDVTGTQTDDANDDLVAAHIHAGPPATPLPPTFPVRWGFFGMPDNDINPKQLVITPFDMGVGGTFTSIWDAPEGNPTGVNDLASQISNILEGRAYLNFHTNQNPGGEIRGTLRVVPEPSSTLLMSLGALGLLGLHSRRRRA